MTYQSPNTEPENPPVDDKGFNDPTAWGYCDWCIFMVAVIDGVLVEHRRYRNSADEGSCKGSGMDPVAEIPETASPKQFVNLVKNQTRGGIRAYWQRQRALHRIKSRVPEVPRATEDDDD